MAIGLAMVAGGTLAAQTRPQPGVKLPMSQIDAQMFHVSAGNRLRPVQWPNGARVAVGLSFDVDNATASLATGDLISESISRGEYGAIAGLEKLIVPMKSKPGVWFATHEQIARYVKGNPRS